MAWRDKLQKGSFRGAPFHWQKADGEVGRKSARHDYPQRDDAYIEDMGKAPREFTLEVFVLGAEYMAARDKLIAACEEPGPGTLVHPTMGTVRVALSGKVRISETTDEGGMCRFTLPFVLAGENKYPTASADTSGVVATRADAALGKVKDNFGKTFSVKAKPTFIGDAAQDLAQSVLTKVNAVRAKIPGSLVPARVTSFVSTLSNIRSSTSSLVHTPLDMANEYQGFMTTLSTLTDNPLSAFHAYRGLFGFGDDVQPVSRTTANRRLQADNQQALVDLVRQTAVIEAARLSSQIDYPSQQDAVTIRDELTDRLDGEMETTTDDDTYQALAALRFAVVQDVTSRGADLARLVSYTPNITLPALVVAHSLYGDATLADDLVARNKIRHPGFVPGGLALEVVTDA